MSSTSSLAACAARPAFAVPFALALPGALVAGLALPFAFAPTEWWPLAPLSVLALYVCLQGRTPPRALLLGWVFGLGYYGIGVHWVYYSLHLFGAAIAPLAAALTALFVLVMTVFPAVGAWLWARLTAAGGHARAAAASSDALSAANAARATSVPAAERSRAEAPVEQAFGPKGSTATVPPAAAAWLFAAIWTLGELLRGKLMGGFPWILVGYSQTSGPLGPLAPLVGVYGIGFLLVGSAVLLWPLGTGPRRSRVAAALSLTGLALAALLGTRYAPDEPVGEPLGVRLVQANIPQEMKFSRERLARSLRLYTSLTRQRSLAEVDLVVWPETAIPTYFDRVEEALAPFVAAMESEGVDVLSGGFHREGEEVWNSVRQLGGARALYRKRHLVPFGEYMPLRFVLDWFVRFIDIPMSDLAEGRGPHVPLDVAGERVGVSICYEDVYGEEMRALLPASTLLVNVSNDAWFGDSAAPHQHEQKARMRAREFARPLVRVTNTGVSSAIRADGSVVARIAHDTQGAIDVTVQPRTGTTLYARTGNWPVFLAALAVLGGGFAFCRRRAARTLS